MQDRLPSHPLPLHGPRASSTTKINNGTCQLLLPDSIAPPTQLLDRQKLLFATNLSTNSFTDRLLTNVNQGKKTIIIFNPTTKSCYLATCNDSLDWAIGQNVQTKTCITWNIHIQSLKFRWTVYWLFFLLMWPIPDESKGFLLTHSLGYSPPWKARHGCRSLRQLVTMFCSQEVEKDEMNARIPFAFSSSSFFFSSLALKPLR